MFSWIILIVLLIIAAFQDFRKKEISILVMTLCSLNSIICVVLRIMGGNTDIQELAMSLLPGIVLILIGFASNQSLGYGDGLLTLSFSPVLGLSNVCIGLMAAMTASALVSLFLLVVKKADKKTRLPFVPFIALGVGVTFVAQI